MGQKSLYLEKKLLDLVLGATAYTAPVTLYLALYTVIPDGTASSGTEVTGTGYARLAITNNSTNFTNATGSASPASKTTGTTFTMATAGADWSSAANVVAWGLLDASSAGNLLWYGSVATPAPVLSGNTPVFASGGLVITEA